MEFVNDRLGVFKARFYAFFKSERHIASDDIDLIRITAMSLKILYESVNCGCIFSFCNKENPMCFQVNNQSDIVVPFHTCLVHAQHLYLRHIDKRKCSFNVMLDDSPEPFVILFNEAGKHRDRHMLCVFKHHSLIQQRETGVLSRPWYTDLRTLSINKSKKYVEKAVSGVAESMQNTLQTGLTMDVDGISGSMMRGGGKESVINNYTTNNNHTFTQNNTSPKALNRYEIYRQTKNLIHMVKAGR